jgi:hypothetical protein
MPIRKKQDPSDPILIYGLKVDPAKHPALHQHLLSLGLGRPRLDYIRDQLEAMLTGQVAASTATSITEARSAGNTLDAAIAPVMPAPDPAALKPVATEPEESPEELAKRRAAAALLVSKFE